MSFIKCQWRSQDFCHNPDGNLSRVDPVQSRIKSIIITASSIVSLRSHQQQSPCPCSRISSTPHVPAVYPAQKKRSSAAGVDLWWSANHRMKWFRATFLSPTRGTEGVVKTIERSGFLFFPEGRRPRWEVDPPLRVREDWWVFEDLLRFKGGLVGFRKTLKVKGGLVFFRRFKELLLFFRMLTKYL